MWHCTPKSDRPTVSPWHLLFTRDGYYLFQPSLLVASHLSIQKPLLCPEAIRYYNTFLPSVSCKLFPLSPLVFHPIGLLFYPTSWWQLSGHRKLIISLPDHQQAVTNFYECGQLLPPETQTALFQCSLQDMLTLPPAALQAWLECSSLYIKQQMKAIKTHAKLKTPDICSFFVTLGDPMTLSLRWYNCWICCIVSWGLWLIHNMLLT